jgi:RHS repeat-associated protein
MTLAPALQATGESDAADAAPRRGSTYYHLYDQLGSTRKLLDSNQATTDSYAFGEVRTSSGSTPNPFKFVGQLGYYDDPSTDFQYLRARYYAPAYGRFLEVDPLMLATGHPYSYVQGCPTSRQDPSGAIGKTPCPPESEYNRDPHCKLYASNSRKIDQRIPAVPCQMCWELGGAHCETMIINPSDPNEVVLGVTCTQHWTCEWYTQTVVVHKWKCWYQWECTYDTCNGQVKDYPQKTVFIPAGQSYESIVPVEPPVYYETKTVWAAAVCEQCESEKKNPSTCGR